MTRDRRAAQAAGKNLRGDTRATIKILSKWDSMDNHRKLAGTSNQAKVTMARCTEDRFQGCPRHPSIQITTEIRSWLDTALMGSNKV